MKNLLMIALEFAPVNSTGCYRYLKFIKYLPSYGYKITVVAPPVEDLSKLHLNAIIDNKLNDQIPTNVEVIRIPLVSKNKYSSKDFTFKSKVKHYLNYKGDRYASYWMPNLKKYLDEKFSKKEFDLVFISIPPFSLGVELATYLKKYKMPFVLDMRDEWSLNKGVPFPTYFHYLYAKKMEKLMFENASQITSVTPQLISIFKRAHPSIKPEKFNLITNGFDFVDIDVIPFKSSPYRKDKKYIIGYAGSFYYDPVMDLLAGTRFFQRPGIKKITYRQNLTKEDWSYRGPKYFLLTLRELFTRRPDLKECVEFHHIGHLPSWLTSMVGEYGLESNFVSHGYVTKEKNIEIQKSFNALLCTSEKVINGEHYCLSSKVFDYVHVKKPILAFVTAGILKEFVENSNCGIIFDPDDIQKSAVLLENFLEVETQFDLNYEYLKNFTTPFLTKLLANVLDASVSNNT